MDEMILGGYGDDAATVKKGGGSIVWYPGHMTAAKRSLQKSLSLVDFAIELLDARIPVSSQNPDFKSLCAGKPILTLLSKATLADEKKTQRFITELEKSGRTVIAIDSKTKLNYGKITPAIKSLLSEKLERYAAKGMAGRKIRGMVIGVTNVGKSTFINGFTGTNKAKAEDRPGVTRSTQWIAAPNGIELLDTPGLLWHKFDDPAVGEKLAFTGAIRDEILDLAGLAVRLTGLLAREYTDLLEQRYKISIKDKELEPFEIFELIAKKRGFILRGNEIDYDRCAVCILDEFRGGKIGKITLD